ncbi:hypothetical protein ACVWYG_002642 [Pedobacter sp. UYEF25]
MLKNTIIERFICLYYIFFNLTFAHMTPSEVNAKWKALQQKIAKEFDSDFPDLKVMLFLIGVQELGKGTRKYSKRQKEELMHVATCRLLSEMGFYELEGLDQDGWPHWKLMRPIPPYTSMEQEMLMKSLVVGYFEDIYN